MSFNPSQSRAITVRSILSAFVGLLLLSGLIWVLIVVFIKLFGALAGVTPTLITAATTVLVATFTVMIGRYYKRKREIDAAYREQKLAVYEDFLKVLFKTLLESDERTPSSEEANP